MEIIILRLRLGHEILDECCSHSRLDECHDSHSRLDGCHVHSRLDGCHDSHSRLDECHLEDVFHMVDREFCS